MAHTACTDDFHEVADHQSHHPTSAPEPETHDLLDCINILQNELQNLKSQIQIREAQRNNETLRLKEEVADALRKAAEFHAELIAQKESDALAEKTAERLKDELEKTLQEQQKNEKELASRIEELEKKNELIKHRSHRDESAMKELEAENEVLKRKAAMSWILGCVSDLYLQLQPEGKTAAILKLFQNIQKELEHQNVSSSKLPEIDNDYIENEMKKLIEPQKEELQNPSRKTSARRSYIDSANSKRSIDGSFASSSRRSTDSSLGETARDDHARGQSATHISNDARAHSSSKFNFSHKVAEDDSTSPCVRFILNCFDSPRRINSENSAFVAQSGADQMPQFPPQPSEHKTQIEVFEADPHFDIDPLRLSESTWAEIKVLNRKAAKHTEMVNTSSQIRMMLGSIEKTIASLVELEKRRSGKELAG